VKVDEDFAILLQGRYSPSPLRRLGHGRGRWRKRVGFFEEGNREKKGSARLVVSLMACCLWSSFESNPLRFGWKADRNVCPTRQVDQPDEGGSTRDRWINKRCVGQGQAGKADGGAQLNMSFCRRLSFNRPAICSSAPGCGEQTSFVSEAFTSGTWNFERTHPALTIERRPPDFSPVVMILAHDRHLVRKPLSFFCACRSGYDERCESQGE